MGVAAGVSVALSLLLRAQRLHLVLLKKGINIKPKFMALSVLLLINGLLACAAPLTNTDLGFGEQSEGS